MLDPKEFVAICDGYGAGFIYVPGTATCLRIDGYVRFQVNAVENPFDDVSEGDRPVDLTRFAFDFDARNETDFGTLRGFASMQLDYYGNNDIIRSTPFVGDSDNIVADSIVRTRDAYIQFGTITAGLLDSLWTATQNRVNDGLLTSTDWAVGSFRTAQITINKEVGATVFGLSLEEPADNYIPNIVARASYKDDNIGTYLAAAYSSGIGNENGFGFGFTGNSASGNPVFVLSDQDEDADAFSVKGGISLYDIAHLDNELRFEASYATDPSIYAANDLIESSRGLGVQDDINNVPIEWAIGAGYEQRFGKFEFSASLQYGNTFDLVSKTSVEADEAKFTNAALNFGYAITDNFNVLLEVQHREIELVDDNISQTAGFVRWDRRF